MFIHELRDLLYEMHECSLYLLNFWVFGKFKKSLGRVLVAARRLIPNVVYFRFLESNYLAVSSRLPGNASS